MKRELPMLRMRPARAAAVGAAATAAIALALPAQAGVSRPADPARWHVVYRRNYATLSGYWTIVSAGARDAWVLGGAVSNSGEPIAAHEHDGRWHAVSMPKGSVGSVEAASAVSASDIWAVTTGGDVLSWNGRTWHIVKRFTTGQLTGVNAFSPGNVWVFGASGVGPGAGTWRLRDGRWTKVTGLAAHIGEAGAISASDMWAVAAMLPVRKPPYAVLAHYDGSSWQRVHVTAPKGFGLGSTDVVVAGPGNIWVLGSVGKRHWLLHLHGGQWSGTRAPLDLRLDGAASDGRGGLWAPGSNGNGANYVYHLSSAGRWSVETIGTNGTGIYSITGIPGTPAFLGSGIEVLKAGGDAAVWQTG
jgi:hypothetical protein